MESKTSEPMWVSEMQSSSSLERFAELQKIFPPIYFSSTKFQLHRNSAREIYTDCFYYVNTVLANLMQSLQEAPNWWYPCFSVKPKSSQSQGHCVLPRWAKWPHSRPHTLQSRPVRMWLLTFLDAESETGCVWSCDFRPQGIFPVQLPEYELQTWLRWLELSEARGGE